METHKKQIGILGGNFNPVHNGHLSIARKAYEQFHLDEVWFMPAYIQPLKQGLPVTAGEHRQKMIKLAIADLPNFSVCTYELEKKGVSYTCETLKSFCEQYPDAEFSFIMGADSINTFKNWRNPGQICDCARLLVACRHQEGKPDDLLYQQAAELKDCLNARISFIDAPFYDISSTQIREILSDDSLNESAKEILPEPVVDYIKENHLYR